MFSSYLCMFVKAEKNEYIVYKIVKEKKNSLRLNIVFIFADTFVFIFGFDFFKNPWPHKKKIE